ncbi:MAG: hypothetical protein J6386_05145 [Candidatus Synoicihabitans palmerolidicus]|nr:hypothetical protein [Candidatus Synoicihabitans palmerolidicus]
MTATPIWHLVLKDLRRFAPFAAPAVLFMAADRFFACGSFGDSSGSTNELGIWTTILQWPMIVFVGLALGGKDRAIGDQTFWRTHPQAPTTVAIAKLIGLLILMIHPAALIDFLRALQHDLSASSATLMGLERCGTVGLVSSAALLLGASTTSLLRALTSSLE